MKKETIEKIRAYRTGVHLSQETKEKISNTSKKRVFTEETRNKMTRGNIEINGKRVICVETGKEYESISEASRDIHTAPICISRVCNGKKNSIHGLSFRFL